jgi:hypothetical protein
MEVQIQEIKGILYFIDTSNNMVCGVDNFCIGYEPDSNVYCYSDSNISSCSNIPIKCKTDNDCRSKYDINSPKLKDDTYRRECPVPYSSQSDPWQRYACPNSYARIAQTLPKLTNPDFNKNPSKTAVPISDDTLNYGQIINEITQENQQYIASGDDGIQSTYDQLESASIYDGSTEQFVNSEQIKQNNGNYYLLILVLIIIIVFVIIFFTLKSTKRRGK